MNRPIRARFWKKEEVEHRDLTKIIFGDDKECIGIVLMLNPGSCKPKNGEEIPMFPGEVLLCDSDKTQDNVIDCVEGAYNNNAEGYVYIVNLSTVKDTKRKNLAIKDFSKSSIVVKEIDDIMEDSNNDVKWIWLGFGKKDSDLKTWKNEETRRYVFELKNVLINDLDKKYGKKVVGSSIDYFHPFCFCFKANKNFKQKIINEIRTLIQ